MPTLSRLFPLSRLALSRRVPFRAQALALCALFAIAGVAILDDYGVGQDEVVQRQIARANADYIATGSVDRLYIEDHRYYGVALEMPLLLIERALGLQDSRHIYLMRHLVTHLFFIAGGFACAMLAYRMVGSRWIALLAMLLFLLHPRLYAHSFFNSKDVPFAAMLIVALYLAHRAFRKDTVGAFLLCGAVVGLAINLRPFALMLPPMLLAMRAPDLWREGRAERKRILITGAALAIAALWTAWIAHPYYWENPLRFFEGIRVFSQHPTALENLFMGETYWSNAVPWNFIPVWFAITAPPLALPLGALGAAAVCWQGIARPLAALRDRETCFRILLLGCFALPVVAVIALQANIAQGWRQMYFLWGPFCLLAAIGLHCLANNKMGGIWKIGARLPRWVRGDGRPHMARRALAYGVAGVGLATTLTAMAALHPHQQAYFNALVDTKTPGALGKRYDMDYWQLAQRQMLEYLLARYPDDTLRVYPIRGHSALILPQNDRERIIRFNNPHAADFYLLAARGAYDLPVANLLEAGFYIRPRIESQNIPESPLYAVRAYGSVVAFIVPRHNDADDYRAAYDDVAANGTLLARSAFDIYAYDGALYYLSANCDEPPLANVNLWNSMAFLHIFPAAPADLPAASRERGFESRHFRFNNRAAFFDGKCIAMRSLPDYPIARISTGQKRLEVEAVWRADIDLEAQALYEAIVAGDYGQPAAQSDFDVYLRGNRLAYLKEPCAAGDADARFFLHIFPADPADLPADGRESGFANLDFQFSDYGAYAGDKCVAERELPDYAIERIRTGQFVSGEGRLWGAEFAAGQ